MTKVAPWIVKRPGRWMWRVDRLSHLVDMDSDWNRAYCGARAPFSTAGGEDFFPCKRCLRAVRAGSIEVTPYPPWKTHEEFARGE